jgi:hypothetical protein
MLLGPDFTVFEVEQSPQHDRQLECFSGLDRQVAPQLTFPGDPSCPRGKIHWKTFQDYEVASGCCQSMMEAK